LTAIALFFNHLRIAGSLKFVSVRYRPPLIGGDGDAKESTKMNPANFETVLGDGAIARSPEKTAEVTGLGRTKIFEMIRSGELKARKAGRRTLIFDGDLRECLSRLPLAGNNATAA
jgi:excisionase family DNA binding protein